MAGMVENPILDETFGVAETGKEGNVKMVGWATSSGFVNADELAKKFGITLSFTPSFTGPASGAGVENLESSTAKEVGGRSSTAGARHEAHKTGIAEDEVANRCEESTSTGAGGVGNEPKKRACCGSLV
jgi:hypothetical protein